MSTRWPSSSRARRLHSFATRLASLLALACILLVSAASAAALAAGSSSLGAGTAELSPCDSDGVEWRYSSNSAGQLTSVVVSGIAQACAGGVIRITLLDGSSVVGAASATLPQGGFDGSVSLTLSPTPAATAVTRALVAIEGR